MEGFINVDQAAEVLGYSVIRMYQLAREGTIPAYKRGREWYFKKEELLEHFSHKFTKSTKD